MRSYEDVVDVREDATGAQPRQFLWRGRLYVVRTVLSHWYERTAWWTGPAARAVRGEDADVPAAAAGAAAGGERELWRVEASAGRSSPPGVFDLARSAPGDGGGPWRLVRVVD